MPTSFESQRARLLENLDGFRMEICPDRERADFILDRQPLNVIEIPQRDQLRLVFEELDHDDRVQETIERRCTDRACRIRMRYRHAIEIDRLSSQWTIHAVDHRAQCDQ